mmetsp:Transcript_8514/g.22733  ORF Transcript_8514/g.22733 Transcript_8514/m.22733 type:complete len:131 (+) Transcript_8514:201-593(+)
METLGDANSPVVAAACLPASFLVEGKIHLLPSRLLDPQKESRGGAGDIAADSALETGEGGVVACHGFAIVNARKWSRETVTKMEEIFRANLRVSWIIAHRRDLLQTLLCVFVRILPTAAGGAIIVLGTHW